MLRPPPPSHTPAPAAPCWQRWRDALLGLCFPPACAACGEELAEHPLGAVICSACQLQFAACDAPTCPQCALPLALQGAVCRECQRRPHRFSAAWAVGKYDGSLRDWVLRAKSGRDDALALALGKTLAARLLASSAADCWDGIVPTPAPLGRQLLRAINVADILAEAVATRLHVPRIRGLLRFRRGVRKQTQLTLAQRRRNMRGALVAGVDCDIREARLLVIDDVLTTGATADECARALLAAGAASVAVAVVARGVGYD